MIGTQQLGQVQLGVAEVGGNAYTLSLAATAGGSAAVSRSTSPARSLDVSAASAAGVSATTGYQRSGTSLAPTSAMVSGVLSAARLVDHSAPALDAVVAEITTGQRLLSHSAPAAVVVLRGATTARSVAHLGTAGATVEGVAQRGRALIHAAPSLAVVAVRSTLRRALQHLAPTEVSLFSAFIILEPPLIGPLLVEVADSTTSVYLPDSLTYAEVVKDRAEPLIYA